MLLDRLVKVKHQDEMFVNFGEDGNDPKNQPGSQVTVGLAI